MVCLCVQGVGSRCMLVLSNYEVCRLWDMCCGLGVGVEAFKWEAGGLWAIFMQKDVVYRSWLWGHMRFTSSQLCVQWHPVVMKCVPLLFFMM